MRIIQNNRAKIRDARDKLIELTRKRKADPYKLRLYKGRASYPPMSMGSALRKMHLSELPMPMGMPPAAMLRHPSHMAMMYSDQEELMPLPPPLPPSRRQILAQPPIGYVDYDNMDQMESGGYQFTQQKRKKNKY